MKSSAAVAAIGALFIVFALAALVGAGGFLTAALSPSQRDAFVAISTQQGVPANIARAAIVVVGLFFGGLGVFGAATGVGLLRRLRWARYAAIVFAACGLTMALVMVGALTFVSLPGEVSAQLPASQRAAMQGVYGLFAVVNVLALWILARPETRTLFGSAAAPGRDSQAPPRDAPMAPAAVTPDARPLSITIIAWLSIVGAVMTLATLLGHRTPAVVLGVSLTWPASGAANSLLTAANLVVGFGLLRRMRDTLPLAIGVQMFGLVNALVTLLPAVAARQVAEIMTAAGTSDAANLHAARTVLYSGVGISVASSLITLYFLFAARRRA